MICAVDFAGNIPSNVNHIFFVGLWPTQIDKHRDGVDGVDQGVHEVGEDDEGDVHVLDLFPLEMKESLRERMFEESAVGALDELYEDGDILAPPAVCAVDVGRQLVEIQLALGKILLYFFFSNLKIFINFSTVFYGYILYRLFFSYFSLLIYLKSRFFYVFFNPLFEILL